MNVSLQHAADLIEAAVDAARAEGLRIAAVVLDSGGHLVAAQRMDGAYLSAITIAERKSFTAVNFRTTTAAMRERLSQVEYQIQIQATDTRLAFLPGGVPITDADGSCIGGLGISGGSGAQDVAICEAALAAVTAS